MNVKEIQAIARKHGIKVARQKKAELIHAIQLAEGNVDCFGSGPAIACGESDCLWWGDCMEPTPTRKR